MNQQPSSARGITLLPAGAAQFLKRRSLEAVGLALAVAGALLALALVSYDPADPSWSTAAARPTRNLIGIPGASTADLALQVLGGAAALAPLMLFAWAWRFFSHRGLRWLWWNLTAVPFSLSLGAMFAASLPTPESWPLLGGLGGWLGDELFRLALRGAGQVLPAVPLGVWQLVLGAGATATFALALALSRQEWTGLAAAGLGGARSAAAKVRPGRTGLHQNTDEAAEIASNTLLGGSESTESRAPARSIPVRPPNPLDAPPRIGRTTPAPRLGRRAKAEAQPTLNLDREDEFRLPQLALLHPPPNGGRPATLDEFALQQNARLLETVLSEFGVRGEIAEVNPGPVVTRYELDPAPGTRTARIIGLADDIARSMSAVAARVAVIPGQDRIGIELPNSTREVVYLRELLSTQEYENTAGQLAMAMGKNIAGEPVIADLSRMPHLLIAGTTGSGKSVAVNTMILSLVYRLTPEQCRLILIDPKMLELSVYDGIPHLLTPVVTEPGKAVVALKWAVREMQNRYRSMSRLGVRNLNGYNQRVAEASAKGESPRRTVQTGYDSATGEPVYEEQTLDIKPMPFVVVVVDEMADLMMVAGKDVEAAIQRLSQMARAAGIHLVMATQRPSVDVITGTIKANFPTRVSFQVTSKIDSRTILGEQGAEQLLGQGDMLLMEAGGRIQRVHGPFVSDAEVERVVHALKQQGAPNYLEEVTEEPEASQEAAGSNNVGGGDELYDAAVELVQREQRASTSFVQRHLQIGYNRAARMIERMESEGVVSAPDRVGKREVVSGQGGV